MGFKIQNSITAVHIRKTPAISNSAKAGSLDRLSSGFRINTTEDDQLAAGMKRADTGDGGRNSRAAVISMLQGSFSANRNQYFQALADMATTAENITAADSAVNDTDMAAEITKLT
jgi:flagellin-like hook-associated protein FlgL